MSLRAFVVCEDHTLDQYVVAPVIGAIFNTMGWPRAKVKVVTNPRLSGISHVLAQCEALVRRYAPLGDVVIFAVDLDREDGAEGRKDRRAQFESRLAALDEDLRSRAVVVLAVQELEVWAIWSQWRDVASGWEEVRTERDPKELYFDPLLSSADARQPGGGRSRLIRASLANVRGLMTACPELEELRQDLDAALRRTGR